MTFSELATRIAARAGKQINNTVVASRIKAGINDICKIQWNNYPWSFRRRDYSFVTVPEVSTGTVSVTSGSRALTFSSAVLTSGVHDGAWFNVPSLSPDNWYKIRVVNSTTTATLEVPFQGSNNATASYKIIKTDYLLPPEINDLSGLSLETEGNKFDLLDYASQSQYRPVLTSSGFPRQAAIFKADFNGSTYSTGTVSGSLNTRTLTGVGTSWLANVKEGDSFSDGTESYRVYSVDSDTQITLYNHLTTALSGASYTITSRFGNFIRFKSGFADSHVVHVQGLRAYVELVNDRDFNEMTERFSTEIIESSLRVELSSTPDQRENDILTVSEAMFQSARATDSGAFPRRNYTPIFNPRT